MRSRSSTRIACLRIIIAGIFALPIQVSQAALNLQGNLLFDGVDDVVAVPAHPSLSPSSAITVESWVNLRSISPDKNQDRIVSRSGSYELTVSRGDTGCATGTQGDVQWRATIGGIDRRICGGQFAFDTWHHIAGTYDGTRFKLFIDGALVANIARTGTLAPVSVPLYVGNRPELNRPFDGRVDEVRIWSRALTQGEIQAGIDSGRTGAEANLLLYYRFEEGTGQSVLDSTAAAIHGVLGLSAAQENSDPAWTAGGPPANRPPSVNAGPDQQLSAPGESTQLQGSFSDDGLPDGTLIPNWTLQSGPGM